MQIRKLVFFNQKMKLPVLFSISSFQVLAYRVKRRVFGFHLGFLLQQNNIFLAFSCLRSIFIVTVIFRFSFTFDGINDHFSPV